MTKEYHYPKRFKVSSRLRTYFKSDGKQDNGGGYNPPYRKDETEKEVILKGCD